ncbi:MAG: LPS assembly lipoprotein LptE [Bdellovibrionales bacterium]
MIKILAILPILMLSSCAYQMGYGYKELPRGVKNLYIPIFKNDTLEVGPEVDFTSQLVREVKRANVAKILSKDLADGILEGRIIRITRHQQAPEENKRDGEKKTTGLVNLPEGTYVATQYLLKIKVGLKLKRKSTNQTVWTQEFEDQTVYSAARLALPVINTSTPNYTESEEERVIKNLAGVMMQEAVGRLTENF